jgi:hypothetical protein
MLKPNGDGNKKVKRLTNKTRLNEIRMVEIVFNIVNLILPHQSNSLIL